MNSIKLDAAMTSYKVRIMTAMQKDSDDYTWDQWTCEATITAAGVTYVTTAPNAANSKVVLRYIRWSVVSIVGTGTSMFTVSGIARAG